MDANKREYAVVWQNDSPQIILPKIAVWGFITVDHANKYEFL
jgi:hypothetical protein